MTTANYFQSPQTNSVYVRVTSGSDIFVGVRKISEGYRITVRCDDYDTLANLDLDGFSSVKDGDHRSIVVHNSEMLNYYVDKAVAEIGATNSVLPWQEHLGELESSATIGCPECGAVLHV